MWGKLTEAQGAVIAAIIGGIFLCIVAIVGLGNPIVEKWAESQFNTTIVAVPLPTSTLAPSATLIPTSVSQPARPTSTLGPMLPSRTLEVLSNNLEDVEVLYHDDLERFSSFWDTEHPGVSVSNEGFEMTGEPFWGSHFSQRVPFVKGQGALVLFKYEGGAAFGLFVEHSLWQQSDYRRWGFSYECITIYEERTSLSERLPGDLILKPSTWYYLLLTVDEDAKFSMHVWEENSPVLQGQYRQQFDSDSWGGKTWRFVANGHEGKVYFDTFTLISFSGIK